jgi:hypothetical protein
MRMMVAVLVAMEKNRIENMIFLVFRLLMFWIRRLPVFVTRLVMLLFLQLAMSVQLVIRQEDLPATLAVSGFL